MWPDIRYRAFDLPDIWFLAKLSINIVVIAIETKIFLFYFQEIFTVTFKFLKHLQLILNIREDSKRKVSI